MIVDQADRLKALEHLFDRHPIGLILIGMPGLEKRLARYPQLYSRIGFAHHHRALSADELRFVLTHDWQELGLQLSADDLSDTETVATVARITAGNFRLVPPLRPDPTHPENQRPQHDHPRSRRSRPRDAAHRHRIAPERSAHISAALTREGLHPSRSQVRKRGFFGPNAAVLAAATTPENPNIAEPKPTQMRLDKTSRRTSPPWRLPSAYAETAIGVGRVVTARDGSPQRCDVERFLEPEPIAKACVVGGDDEGAWPLLQCSLQRFQRRGVEMVGRFVEQEQSNATGGRRRQFGTGPLAG